MRKKIYFLAFLLLIGCCDDCVRTDYIYFRLITANGDDYLVANHLSTKTVQLYSIENGDTLRANFYNAQEFYDSTKFYVEIDRNSEILFIDIKNEIQDTIKFDLFVREEKCCGTKKSFTSITSLEIDGVRKETDSGNTFDIIIE